LFDRKFQHAGVRKRTVVFYTGVLKCLWRANSVNLFNNPFNNEKYQGGEPPRPDEMPTELAEEIIISP